jgi:dethiobiotin synthetase
MSAVFVTASGTGVGKTWVVSSLVRQLRARGADVRALKPVITGFDAASAERSDSGMLLAALGLPCEPEQLDRISPWRFAAALAPDMAAAREQRRVPFAALVEYCREAAACGTTLIEGVGGVLVPLDEEHTVADWIAAVGAPAVLVAGSYLGAISHALTAFEALWLRRIPVRAIVVSESEDRTVDTAATARTIERFCRGVPVCALPRAYDPGDMPDLVERLCLADLAGRKSGSP